MRFLALTLIFSGLFIAGCYHQPIEQGNILTPQKTAQVKYGMTKTQVETILGKPVLKNMFQDHRLVYVYTIEPTYGDVKKTNLLITFRKGRVSHIQKS